MIFARFFGSASKLYTMREERGALLVLEGCDRSGKSTQVGKLVAALNAQGIKAEARHFPDRKTVIGQLIDQFLKGTIQLPLESAHLLFSANRWECVAEMLGVLHSGITLVVDRYAASGAAYTSAVTGKSLSWCKQPDIGLPKPDMVALLEVDEATQVCRQNWGAERFERLDIQRRVASNLLTLGDDSWIVVNGNRSLEEIHEELLSAALLRVKSAGSKPLGTLW